MRTATDFVFDSYSAQGKDLTFSYTIHFSDNTSEALKETLKLPIALPESTSNLDPALEALHLALGISYYKVFLPPKFTLPYKLEHEAALFWDNVYRNGLSEFLYLNEISFERLAKFPVVPNDRPQPATFQTQSAALLGIGGGKDSALAGEVLQQIGVPITGFVLGTGDHYGQAPAVAKQMEVEVLGIERQLDPRLLELNKEPGALNGHVPISVIFALIGVLLAMLRQKRYVVVANEASASIPNTSWQGLEVNHQWSKSFTFEQTFQDYIQRYLATDITYFSAIRPLSSVAVSKLFANFPKYFEVFTSDNSVFRIDPAKRANNRWSNDSPKSLSSFILLSPWLSEEQMLKIFGKDFLNEKDLQPLFLALTGHEGHRPLDCVGTAEEIVLSLNLAATQGKYQASALMQVAKQLNIIEEGDWQASLQNALLPLPEQAFPPEIADKLTAYYHEKLETTT